MENLKETANLENLSLRQIRPEEYPGLYKKMKRDFPPDERPPYIIVKRNFDNGVYKGMFLSSGQGEDEKRLAYAIMNAPEGSPYALLVFLAVEPTVRSLGLGAELLSRISALYSNYTIIIEVEEPEAAKTPELREIAQRRIRFYERCGYELIENVKAQIFGAKMLLMYGGGERPNDIGEVMHSFYGPALPSKRLLSKVIVAAK